ncbi:hypothetical protein Adt_37062 [Abeliophyllum distichum]|uniref:Uncharacterized protein n=1 Tax=Abeliophyllum distichum TaxID=126358 RepID=A0ABD1QJT2_9LAMI
MSGSTKGHHLGVGKIWCLVSRWCWWLRQLIVIGQVGKMRRCSRMDEEVVVELIEAYKGMREVALYDGVRRWRLERMVPHLGMRNISIGKTSHLVQFRGWGLWV